MEGKGLKGVAVAMLMITVFGGPLISTHAQESCFDKCADDCADGEGFLTCIDNCLVRCPPSTVGGDKFHNVAGNGGHCLDHCREGCKKQHPDETYSDCESNCPLQCFMQISKSQMADCKLKCSKCMKLTNIGDKNTKECTDQSPAQCMKLMNDDKEKIDGCTDQSPQCMKLMNDDKEKIEGCTDLSPKCMNLKNAGKDQIDECADSCWKSCVSNFQRRLLLEVSTNKHQQCLQKDL